MGVPSAAAQAPGPSVPATPVTARATGQPGSSQLLSPPPTKPRKARSPPAIAPPPAEVAVARLQDVGDRYPGLWLQNRGEKPVILAYRADGLFSVANVGGDPNFFSLPLPLEATTARDTTIDAGAWGKLAFSTVDREYTILLE